MKIALTIALICCLYVSTWGFWRARRTKRDCRWTRWTRVGHCMKVLRSRSHRYHKRVRRRQIPARLGGAPCKGHSEKYVACTEQQYRASMFSRIVAARLDHNMYIAASKIYEEGVITENKCVQDVYDSNGNVIMAGSKCIEHEHRLTESHSTHKRIKRQAVLSTLNRDVLFLIDESASVGRTNFGKFLRLAKALVNSFCGAISIGGQSTRVGVATFNEYQYPHLNFDDYFDKPAVINKIANIRYQGDRAAMRTCLVKAVKFAMDDMLAWDSGRGARPEDMDSQRVVILMTDGCGNCQPSTPLKAALETLGDELKDDKIPVITFLVNSNSSYCFDAMKGLSIGSQCYEQYSVANWTDVDQISEGIENSPCMDAWEIGPTCGL